MLAELAEYLPAILGALGAFLASLIWGLYEVRKVRREMDKEWVHKDEYVFLKQACKGLKKSVDDCERHRRDDELIQLRLKDKIEECRVRQEATQGQVSALTHLLERRIHIEPERDRRRTTRAEDDKNNAEQSHNRPDVGN